jgi:putative transposase
MNSFFSSGWGNSAFHSRGNSGYHFQHRSPKGEGTRLNEVWAMDFVSDALFNGRRIRALTVVDTFSREALAINVGTKLTGLDVIDTLEEIAKERGLPERIKSDNGTEFTSLVYDKWAYEKGITTDYSRRGKPTDNGTIERFNGSLRDECLNVNWFLSTEDACEKIEEWRQDYNFYRPHSSLNNQTPYDFAATQRSEKILLFAGPGFG